jgi:transaldolase
MSGSLLSLVQTGTKLWLDSVDPDLVQEAKRYGATGATSNPIIVSDLLKSGRYDEPIQSAIDQGLSDEQIAWKLTDQLVKDAQAVFLNAWERTSGNDGYVSFELDPLIEDPDLNLPQSTRVARYVELGKKWSAKHRNRMIKVPATAAGLASLEDLSAASVPLNVTLIFSPRQYVAARDAIWRGARKRPSLNYFKSVYSIFVSRVDVYTAKHCSDLSLEAQGMVGIVNSKKIWNMNREFWRDKECPLQQEIIFASTGTKQPTDAPWKYVAALAGSDIQTNPPATNQAIAVTEMTFNSQIHQMPDSGVLQEIDKKVDIRHLEETLMAEGITKFAQPQKDLLKLIGKMRTALAR